MLIRTILTDLVLPPALQILLVLAGLLLWRFRRGLAMLCFVVSFSSLVLFSLPVVATALHESLEIYPALDLETLQQQDLEHTAIVVLGGGAKNGEEYAGEAVKLDPLGRLRYGAKVFHATGLPVLVSGGTTPGFEFSEAELMAEVLAEFGVESVMLERLSGNTWENARYSADILQRQGIKQVVLVTQAGHLRRGVYCFEQFGFKVIPAPTLFSGSYGDIRDYVPAADALQGSAAAIYEWLGLAVYSVFYEPPPNLGDQDDQQAQAEDGPPAE